MNLEWRDVGICFALAMLFTPLMKWAFVPFLIAVLGIQSDIAEQNLWVVACILAIGPAVLLDFVLFHYE